MKTILVVDDEPCIRDIVRLTLENRDCRVLETADGKQGLEIAAREHTDLVLLDCRMHGMSGTEVLTQLRAEPATADIPVVLMSGIQDAETEHAARLLHADGYLLKPFRPVELLSEIQRALNGGQKQQAA